VLHSFFEQCNQCIKSKNIVKENYIFHIIKTNGIKMLKKYGYRLQKKEGNKQSNERVYAKACNKKV
jgi:hypothetical protein